MAVMYIAVNAWSHGHERFTVFAIRRLRCLVFSHHWIYISVREIHYAYCDNCLKSVYVKSE